MADGSPPIKKVKKTDFITEIANNRKEACPDIIKCRFNKNRVKIVTDDVTEVKENCKGIVYWMFRDARVQDNWAFLYAQKLAIKNKVPLHVCFCILPKFLDATVRHYKFLLEGLAEVEKECQELNINFHLILGESHKEMVKFVKKYEMGAIVTDFFPLRTPMYWVEEIRKNLPEDVPFAQVDAHNIVPCWIASNKLEYGARTIRNKINSKLDEYLTEFPPVIYHEFSTKQKFEKNKWDSALDHVEIDRTVDKVEWATGGYTHAVKVLESFIHVRLRDYNDKRNNPNHDALSNLSPWFHFGMISVQRCIIEVSKYKTKHKQAVEVFCEEAIVRRELSDNFCFYNPNYDSIKGAYDWAKQTLEEHRKDKREYVYTLEELEKGLTHEDLWNAAQIQLVKEGKIHGFMRMYWAKKILEWTATPEDALKWSIYLNDKYSMDGRDPSGYVGCMWSICGIHDQGWKERPIFGKIRYMNYNGCRRKFDVPAFVMKYGAKEHRQNKDKKGSIKDFLSKKKKK